MTLPRRATAWFLTLALSLPCMRAEMKIVAAEPLQAGHKAELRLLGAPTVENNFDSDQIRIDATIRVPNGQSFTVPAFWFKDFGADGSPLSAAEWRVRFTPSEAGRYEIGISVAEGANPPVASARAQFSCASAPGAKPSVEWVSVRGSDLWLGNREPFHLLGENVGWGDRPGAVEFGHYFDAMHAAGENFARVWLSPWSFPLEHRPGTLNRYPLDTARELDRVFDLAETDQIYIVLSLDHHGMYETRTPGMPSGNSFWDRNPYNRALGGPAASPREFFTSAAAEHIYQKRLRYLIARYGYTPRLLAWEFFNEIDNEYPPNGELDAAEVTAWHAKMSQWLRDADPFHHLITTSLTGGSERPPLWRLPDIDIANYHSYSDPDPARYIERIAHRFEKDYAKPVMIEEFGVSPERWARETDPFLRGFRQAMWGSVMSGTVGSAMPWWWQDIAKDNVYPFYAAMHDVLGCAQWQQSSWVPLGLPEDEPPVDVAAPEPNAPAFSATLTLSDYRRFPVRGRVAIANPLAAARASEALSAYLIGSIDHDRQQPIRIAAWFGADAQVSFRVDGVAQSAEVIVRIDDQERGRAVLHTANRQASPTPESTHDFSFALTPGHHVIEISNAGADWARLANLTLQNARVAPFADGWSFHPEILGLRGKDRAQAIVYVYSPAIAYPAGATDAHPPRQAASTFVLPHWPRGAFRVEWFDAASGAPVRDDGATSVIESGQVKVPAFSEDMIGIITPR